MQPVTTKPISLLIVDEHPLLRGGFRYMLRDTPDIQVVAEASTPDETRNLIDELSPSVTLVAVHLCPFISEHITAEKATYTAILAITQNENDFLLAKMQNAGAVGFVKRSDSFETLISAIRRAATGEILFTPEQMLRARRWKEDILRKWESLTPREQQILQMLTKGLGNQALADALGVSYKAIAYHIAGILNKLRVNSRQEAANWVFEYFFPETLEELPRLVWGETAPGVNFGRIPSVLRPDLAEDAPAASLKDAIIS